jgi:L-lactate dehydrogenase complex protein LldE
MIRSSDDLFTKKGEGCKLKVSLFVTCLIDMFQNKVGKATVEVLENLGN